MQPTREQLQRNLQRVQQEVAEACSMAGRDLNSVRIVGVTKYVDAEIARSLAEIGQLDLGENRPQQLAEKVAAIDIIPVRWHMIGHLQRNKIKLVVPACHLIHSVDSLRLLQSISEFAVQKGTVAKCLLEINISGEAAKHGLRPDEMQSMLDAAAGLGGISVHGLMAMSGLDSTPDESLRQFVAVRELRDRLAEKYGEEFPLPELSMGMSGDSPQAVEAGATLLRIGSRLFETD